jgi:hypothetical protein
VNKVQARSRVAMAIANGSLIRQPCEVCGVERGEAHHHDYSKPLDVRWLCRTHHMSLHRATRRSAPRYLATVCLRIPAPLHDEIKQLAEENERTLSAELRLVVKNWLGKAREPA